MTNMASEQNSVTMNVSLPEPLKEYVEGRVSSGIYGSASEFVREAIREKLQRDQEREEARAMLTHKLLEGLDSGKPVPFVSGHFKARKRALIEQAGKKKTA